MPTGSRPRTAPSYAAGVRRPDVLVELKLKARRQSIFKHPACQRGRLKAAEGWAQQHRVDPRRQAVAGNHRARPFVIGAIADYEFHLVVCGQIMQVAPQVAMGLAAARTFEIHDLDHPRVKPADVGRPRGLDHHLLAVLQQCLAQRVHSLLQQRLAAGDFHQRTAIALDLLHDLGHRHPAAFVKGVLRVAPHASQVAGGQAHERAWAPGMRGFALHAVKDLVDDEMPAVLGHYSNCARAAAAASCITMRSATRCSSAARRQSSYSGLTVVAPAPRATLTRIVPQRVAIFLISRSSLSRATGWKRTPMVVVSSNSTAATASRNAASASTETVNAGRPFFMMVGVRVTSRAPAASSRSQRWP